jgi:hypothetical protein
MTVTRVLSLTRKTLAAAITAVAAICLASSIGPTGTAAGHHRTDLTHATKEWKSPSTREVTLATKEWKKEWKVETSSPDTTKE